MTNLINPNEYTIMNCNPPAHCVSTDTTKFVIITVRVGNIDCWTYFEWFYFNIPLKILFEWIEFNEKGLQNVKYDLFIELNNKTSLLIERSNKLLLKDFCSSHVVEISCKRSSRQRC